MAIIPVTVYKFKAGALCYMPTNVGFEVWKSNPDATFIPVKRADIIMLKDYDYQCTKDNYCIVFGEPIADSFCSESLDGTVWEINNADIQYVVLGDAPMDYNDNYRNEYVAYYIAKAEELVIELLTRRKEEEPDFWEYTYHTVWTHWNDNDWQTGEYDGGCDYIGVVDVSHAYHHTNKHILEVIA